VTNRRRTTQDDLARARESLARARAASADPWRVAELQLRYDRLLETALEEDAAGPRPALARHTAPAARTRVEPFPLAWVDESGRTRRSRGEPS
jgi:hypothetical protein